MELLASINFSEDLIAMYLQDDLLKDSPIYQKLIKKGLEQGLEQGLQEGESLIIIKCLHKRFGSLNKTLEKQISNLSREQLETLGENLFDFQSLEDVNQYLNRPMHEINMSY